MATPPVRLPDARLRTILEILITSRSVLILTCHTALVAVSGCFYTLGGIAMCIAGLAEFILGNTFPFTVFIIYGAHWVAQGYANSPMANLTVAFGTDGALSPAFNAGGGFYNVTLCLISTVFFFASLRTNVPFVIVFITLIILFALLAAANFHIGQHGEAGLAYAGNLLKAAGAFGFVTALMVCKPCYAVQGGVADMVYPGLVPCYHHSLCLNRRPMPAANIRPQC